MRPITQAKASRPVFRTLSNSDDHFLEEAEVNLTRVLTRVLAEVNFFVCQSDVLPILYHTSI